MSFFVGEGSNIGSSVQPMRVFFMSIILSLLQKETKA